MNIKEKTFLTILCLFIVSFGDGSSGQPSYGNGAETPIDTSRSIEQTLSTLRDNGDFPKLDRSDSLLGSDADDNGIRDDIDVYIKSLPLNPEQSKAMNRSARWYQSIFTVDTTDQDKALEHSDGAWSTIVCMERAFGTSSWEFVNYEQKLQAFTFNTPSRTDHYVDYNKALDGMVSSLSRKNSITCP